jgi:hypothetical protein
VKEGEEEETKHQSYQPSFLSTQATNRKLPYEVKFQVREEKKKKEIVEQRRRKGREKKQEKKI